MSELEQANQEVSRLQGELAQAQSELNTLNQVSEATVAPLVADIAKNHEILSELDLRLIDSIKRTEALKAKLKGR